MVTTIQISDEFWKFLNDKKEVGESFEEVIKRLLNKGIKGGLSNDKKTIKNS